MANRLYSAGDIIFRQGDASDFAYIVHSGRVELTTVTEGHVESRICGSGELFAERSLVSGIPHDSTAKALEDVSLKAISRYEYNTHFDVLPDDIQKLIKALSTNAKGAASKDVNDFIVSSNIDRAAKAIDSISRNYEKYLHSGGVLEDKIDPEDLVAQHFNKVKIDYGILTPLLEDPEVNDILINRYDDVYIERKGILEKTHIQFNSEREVVVLAKQIMAAINRDYNPHRPLMDARLLDGSRVNIIAPPLAVDGTGISIRKFSEKKLTLENMREQGNISESLQKLLEICGYCRLNIIISGGTGAGKTTLLNAISNHIGQEERVVTIEDAAELQLQKPHVVRLETKPLSLRNCPEDEVSMRDLVKNALRMRPDRIIVGEVRGPEAFDMLQAMNTGHEGSLSTVHANHPRDALSRIENMISMANLQIDSRAIRQQISSALNLIIQISRMRDGKRRVTFVSEIVGMEGDTITMQELFHYQVKGEDENGGIIGKFKWTGIMPRFIRRVGYYGKAREMEDALGVKIPNM